MYTFLLTIGLLFLVFLCASGAYFWSLFIYSRIKQSSFDDAAKVINPRSLWYWINDITPPGFENDASFFGTVKCRLAGVLPKEDMAYLEQLGQNAISASFIQFYPAPDGIYTVGIAVGNVSEDKKPIVEGVLKDVVQEYLFKYGLPRDVYSKWSVWGRYGIPMIEYEYVKKESEIPILDKHMSSNFKTVSVDNVVDLEEEIDLFGTNDNGGV